MFHPAFLQYLRRIVVKYSIHIAKPVESSVSGHSIEKWNDLRMSSEKKRTDRVGTTDSLWFSARVWRWTTIPRMDLSSRSNLLFSNKLIESSSFYLVFRSKSSKIDKRRRRRKIIELHEFMLHEINSKTKLFSFCIRTSIIRFVFTRSSL